MGTLEERVLLSADFQYITNYNQTLLVNVPAGGSIEYYYGASKGVATVGSSANLKYVPNAGSVGIDHFMAHIRYSNPYANSGYPNYGGYGGNSYTYYDQSVEVNIYLPGPTPYDDSSYTYHDPSSGVDTFTNYFVLKGNTLNVPASGGLLKNDHVGDNSNPLVNLTAIGVTGGYYGNQWKHGGVLSQYGTVSVSGSGAFTYTPFPWAFDLPNFSGLTDTFSYYVKDMAGQESETAQVTVDLAMLDVTSEGLDVSINRNGNDLANGPLAERLLNPWAGEQIAVSVRVKGKANLQGAKYQWTVGSGAIDNYIQVEAPDDHHELGHAEVIPLSADELKTAAPIFYWYTGGTKGVSVTVTALGQTGADIAIFTVHRPQNHITSVTTSVNCFQTGVNVTDKVVVRFGEFDSEGKPDPKKPGIKFSQTPDTEAATIGGFRWTQTVSYYYQESHPGFFNHASWSGLDNEIMYDVAGAGVGTSDSPQLDMPPTLNWAEGCFAADMYLMFKSYRPNSIAVPVENVQWCVSWRAERGANNQWSVVSSNWTHDPEGVDSVWFPTWTDVVKNGVVPWVFEPPLPQ